MKILSEAYSFMVEWTHTDKAGKNISNKAASLADVFISYNIYKWWDSSNTLSSEIRMFSEYFLLNSDSKK